MWLLRPSHCVRRGYRRMSLGCQQLVLWASGTVAGPHPWLKLPTALAALLTADPQIPILQLQPAYQGVSASPAPSFIGIWQCQTRPR